MFLNFPLDPRISIWMFFIRFVLVIIGAYVPKLHFKETRDEVFIYVNGFQTFVIWFCNSIPQFCYFVEFGLKFPSFQI